MSSPDSLYGVPTAAESIQMVQQNYSIDFEERNGENESHIAYAGMINTRNGAKNKLSGPMDNVEFLSREDCKMAQFVSKGNFGEGKTFDFKNSQSLNSE